MNKQFEPIYQSLQDQRQALLDRVKASPEVYNLAPSKDKWSISQILMHLITSERVSLGYMKKKSQGIEQLRDSGFMEKIRLWIMILSQRIPLKYKAPKVLVENTPTAPALDDLINQWDAVRTDLAEFLNKIDDRNIHKIIYRHPVAGRLDAQQAMIFFREHIIHHTPQILRILNLSQK